LNAEEDGDYYNAIEIIKIKYLCTLCDIFNNSVILLNFYMVHHSEPVQVQFRQIPNGSVHSSAKRVVELN
jgi:hypothetical protein